MFTEEGLAEEFGVRADKLLLLLSELADQGESLHLRGFLAAARDKGRDGLLALGVLRVLRDGGYVGFEGEDGDMVILPEGATYLEWMYRHWRLVSEHEALKAATA